MIDKPDKKTESINALKNANKHLSDLFSVVNNKDAVLAFVASELQYIARQCGEIQVRVFEGNSQINTGLKIQLEKLAAKLNEAR